MFREQATAERRSGNLYLSLSPLSPLSLSALSLSQLSLSQLSLSALAAPSLSKLFLPLSLSLSLSPPPSSRSLYQLSLYQGLGLHAQAIAKRRSGDLSLLLLQGRREVSQLSGQKDTYK